ncbi:hypothetical protein HPB51_023574 [Rhipicephalus microplus]|uniref:Uncharacterized protein n=1 Tax=Rhipicephalus microplus TaxID=6941 RepID=A0A9J6DCQ1_RHIMP|nr:hypothetical protein HPB51_023574 [Rhipicephalus microplus]
MTKSLLRNKSITDLGLGVCLYYCKGVECLGEAVVRSERIRKIRLLSWLSSAGRRFLRGVRSGVSENYSLCSATLKSKHAHVQWAADYNLLCDTARRNLGYVARAAKFLKQARCDTPCAAALDRVHRHPALVAELSKVLSVSETDAVVAVYDSASEASKACTSSCDWPAWLRSMSRVSRVTMTTHSWMPSTSTAGLT